jgi:hypothetical protein
VSGARGTPTGGARCPSVLALKRRIWPGCSLLHENRDSADSLTGQTIGVRWKFSKRGQTGKLPVRVNASRTATKRPDNRVGDQDECLPQAAEVAGAQIRAAFWRQADQVLPSVRTVPNLFLNLRRAIESSPIALS